MCVPNTERKSPTRSEGLRSLFAKANLSSLLSPSVWVIKNRSFSRVASSPPASELISTAATPSCSAASAKSPSALHRLRAKPDSRSTVSSLTLPPKTSAAKRALSSPSRLGSVRARRSAAELSRMSTTAKSSWPNSAARPSLALSVVSHVAVAASKLAWLVALISPPFQQPGRGWCLIPQESGRSPVFGERHQQETHQQCGKQVRWLNRQPRHAKTPLQRHVQPQFDAEQIQQSDPLLLALYPGPPR